MGADLYIEPRATEIREKFEPLFELAVKARNVLRADSPEREAAQKAVETAHDAMYPDECYFRDSYNHTSVFWRLGLSWWKDIGDALDDEGILPSEACLDFADRIEAADLDLPTDPEWFKDKLVLDDDENSIEVWHEYWTDKRSRLVAFLRRGADANGVRCSI